jgi:hypothetical protein
MPPVLNVVVTILVCRTDNTVRTPQHVCRRCQWVDGQRTSIQLQVRRTTLEPRTNTGNNNPLSRLAVGISATALASCRSGLLYSAVPVPYSARLAVIRLSQMHSELMRDVTMLLSRHQRLAGEQADMQLSLARYVGRFKLE